METMEIKFKGSITVEKNDVKLFGSDGDELDQRTINKLSSQQIIDGLQDGTYILNFIYSYGSALSGEESYEFFIGETE